MSSTVLQHCQRQVSGWERQSNCCEMQPEKWMGKDTAAVHIRAIIIHWLIPSILIRFISETAHCSAAGARARQRSMPNSNRQKATTNPQANNHWHAKSCRRRIARVQVTITLHYQWLHSLPDAIRVPINAIYSHYSTIIYTQCPSATIN